MTIINRVPTITPNRRCEATTRSKTGAVIRCCLIAGHDEAPRFPGWPPRHYFTPWRNFDARGEMHMRGRVFHAPKDIYKGKD